MKPKNDTSLSKPLFNSCHTGPHILLQKLGYQSLPNLGKSHYIQSSWFFFERVLLSKKEQHGQVDRTFRHVFYTKSIQIIHSCGVNHFGWVVFSIRIWKDLSQTTDDTITWNGTSIFLLDGYKPYHLQDCWADS